MTSANTINNGSCLCGAIRYTLNGKPMTTVLCHCKNCKKSSGSSFQANLFFKQDQLTFLSGEDTLRKYQDHDTNSCGAPLRMFCSVCGSNVITTNEQSDFVRGNVIVMSGCLEGVTSFEPELEFYCKDKCGFVDVKTKTQKYEKMT
ncbi:DUF636 domain protein [Ophiobolus disseminans]|uniref:DUF636 domain protein n=1 Tax=Ophiobolus disseminans TaxID=1469910 RepID=A0A6A6ZG93_9PLEO|nr:DUF636 domain protein [Ophiobolus disseminans]